MASNARIDSLNPEVLSMILEYVVEGSFKPIPTLNLVNHYFNDITKNLVGRSVRLTFSKSDETEIHEKINRILADGSLLRNIRHLTIADESRHMKDLIPPPIVSPASNQRPADRDLNTLTDLRRKRYEKVWLPLEQLILHIFNLKTLEWSVAQPLPAPIIKVLQTRHVNSCLKIFRWTRAAFDMDHADPDEQALAQCPNLQVMHTKLIDRNTAVVYDYRYVAFWRIVVNAPNLNHATIIRRRPISFRDNYLLVDRQKAALFPITSPSTSINSITVEGFDSSMLEEIEEYVDISRIESLKYSSGCPDAGFFDTARLKMSRLKSLSLNLSSLYVGTIDPEIPAAMEAFFSDHPGLEFLSIFNWRKAVSLSTVIRYHGNSLKSLHLHEREVLFVGTRRPHDLEERKAYTPDEIENIRVGCPKIRDLTIDLNLIMSQLNDSETQELYHQLSLFRPSLKSIQIYFLTNESRLNLSDLALLPIFHSIYRSIFFGGLGRNDKRQFLLPPSTLLSFKFGEWEKYEDLYALYYKIRPAEREDLNSWGCISVELQKGNLERLRGVVPRLLCEHYPHEVLEDQLTPVNSYSQTESEGSET